MVPVDYFFNNDLKYLQGGISTMTYTTSITKIKAAQYDLLGIEDMVRNIWSPVKVTYDKHALWGISHWRDQHKTFYGYARGLKSTHDVYSTKRILEVTRVEVMRKHRYGYLREIEVRRADNGLYTFKEGDFPRLRISYIEDTDPYCSEQAYQSLKQGCFRLYYSTTNCHQKHGYSKKSQRSLTGSQKLLEEDQRHQA
ncbi:hypothetical protein Tco_1554981 [Tanacetum coccineum]